MDEKNNRELSVDELLAKLKSNLMEESQTAEAAEPAPPPPAPVGTGRELFAFMRHGADNAEHGGSTMLAHMEGKL